MSVRYIHNKSFRERFLLKLYAQIACNHTRHSIYCRLDRKIYRNGYLYHSKYISKQYPKHPVKTLFQINMPQIFFSKSCYPNSNADNCKWASDISSLAFPQSEFPVVCVPSVVPVGSCACHRSPPLPSALLGVSLHILNRPGSKHNKRALHSPRSALLWR